MRNRFEWLRGDREALRRQHPLWRLVTIAVLVLAFLTSCAVRQVTPEDRIFQNLSLDFLGEYELSESSFQGMPVGGISAIAYDGGSISSYGKPGFRFYAVSQDSSKWERFAEHPENGSPRFYTLRLDVNSSPSASIRIEQVEIEEVTFLRNLDGELFPKGEIYPEGIGLSPRNTVFVASAGKSDRHLLPFVGEFDLKTGELLRTLPIPERYLPDEVDGKQLGVQDGFGFDTVTLDRTSFSPGGVDPFRLFAAIELPLLQDRDGDAQSKLRMLHYAIADRASLLVSENMYLLDGMPESKERNALVDLVALGKGGYFLSLERSVPRPDETSLRVVGDAERQEVVADAERQQLDASGYGDRIFQVFTGNATDTSRIASLKGELPGVQPVKKKLLLDLAEVHIALGNLAAMTLGPRLPDGSQSLVVISNEDLGDRVRNSFLLFRLHNS